MAQEVERRLGKAEATGSNPVSSLEKTRIRFEFSFFIYKIKMSKGLNFPSGLFFQIFDHNIFKKISPP